MTSIIPPAKHACPWCGAMVSRSYEEVRDIGDGAYLFINTENSHLLWSDGAITTNTPQDSRNDYPEPLSQLNDYIAKCPACFSLYPALFIPWLAEEGRADNATAPLGVLMSGIGAAIRPGPYTDCRNYTGDFYITKATFQETLEYLEHCHKGQYPALHWGTWTAAQQLVIQGSSIIRSGNQIEPELERRARGSVHTFLRTVSYIKEGCLRFLANEQEIGSIANFDSREYYRGGFQVQEELVLANMNRIAGYEFNYGALPSFLDGEWENDPTRYRPQDKQLSQLLLRARENFESDWAISTPLEPTAYLVDESLSFTDIESEVTLGEIIAELDIDYKAGPAIVFFVKRDTAEVGAIAMFHPLMGESHLEMVSLAIKGAYKPGDDFVEFWRPCYRAEFEEYLQGDYEMFLFDWGSEDDSPGSGADIDPDNAIEWEIPLVQRWARSERLTFLDVKKVGKFFGNVYSMEELTHYLG